MAKLEKIYIPSLTLELDSDARIVAEIVLGLGKVSLDEANLLYCGVDGETIERTSKVPDLPRTFAVDYESFVKEAWIYDRTSYNGMNHPLTYARQAESLPAVIVYDQASLQQVPDEDYLWAPKPGSTLSGAARAVILFADKA